MDESRTCAKCGERQPGPGGILCLVCRTQLAERTSGFWNAPPVDDTVYDAFTQQPGG
jgi:hypothetical protein